MWMYLLSSGNDWNRRVSGNVIFFLLLFCFFPIYVRNEGGLVLAVANSWNGRISNVREKKSRRRILLEVLQITKIFPSCSGSQLFLPVTQEKKPFHFHQSEPSPPQWEDISDLSGRAVVPKRKQLSGKEILELQHFLNIHWALFSFLPPSPHPLFYIQINLNVTNLAWGGRKHKGEWANGISDSLKIWN